MLWLLSGYVWLYIHRPFEIWPVLAKFQLERLYMIVTIMYWFFYPHKRWISNRLNPAFLGFVLVLLLCWLISPYPAMGTQTVEDYLKVAVFYVLLMSTVRDEHSLRKLVTVYLVSVGLYMAHSLREYYCGQHRWDQGIERMIGVDKSFEDPNTFAATLLYSLPITLPFWTKSTSGWGRFLLACYAGLTVLCINKTGSRSALIGLICLGLICALGSRYRWRLILALAVAAPLAWTILPKDIQDRYLTLIDPKYGPKNAEESAESRRQGLLDGIKMWEENPLTGVGPGAFKRFSSLGLEAHNLYGQVVGELGTLGALSFAGIVLALALNAAEIRRLCRLAPALRGEFPYHLARAVAIVVVLLLLLGGGGHNLYRYTWMWFGAFQAIALQGLRTKARAGQGGSPHRPSLPALVVGGGNRGKKRMSAMPVR